MKIAFIVDCFPSLSETFILNQITKLIDLGHKVTIFSGHRANEQSFHTSIQKYNLLEHTYYHNDKPKNRLLRFIEFIWIFLFQIFIHPLPVIRSLNFFKYGKDAFALTIFYKTVLFLSTGPFDIIQCHFGPNGNLGALLKEIGIKGKLVAMFHGYDIRKGIEEGGHIYQDLFNKADALLSISKYNKDNLIRFGAVPDKIEHLPVGIDLKDFPFKEYQGPVQSEKIVSLITVARLVELKGLEYSIKAIHEIVTRHGIKNIRYHILGEGPLEDKLIALSKKLGIENYVYFLGPQNQDGVNIMLQRSDIYILSSLAEALPVTLMEAHSVGLPIIATLTGSTDEIVIDGISGFLVPRGDIYSLVDKIKYLIEHRDIWEKMGKKGRDNIEKNFDIGKLTEKLICIYSALLTK